MALTRISLRSSTSTWATGERWKQRVSGSRRWRRLMRSPTPCSSKMRRCASAPAIVLRPGAPSRFGEAEAITADLEARFATVARVDDGFVDGGDILVTDREVLVGLSARTNAAGAEALAAAVAPTGRRFGS